MNRLTRPLWTTATRRGWTPMRTFVSSRPSLSLNHSRALSLSRASLASRESHGPREPPPSRPPPASNAPGASAPAQSKVTFASLSRQYGPTAILVYLTMTFITFLSCITAVVTLGIDASHVSALFNRIKTTLGFPPSPPPPPTSTLEGPSAWISQLMETYPSLAKAGTTILIAMAMTKLVSPIKFMLTVMVTPRVAGYLKSKGWQLGKPRP